MPLGRAIICLNGPVKYYNCWHVCAFRAGGLGKKDSAGSNAGRQVKCTDEGAGFCCYLLVDPSVSAVSSLKHVSHKGYK